MMPAQNELEAQFAYFTECALATVEDLESLKGCAKSRVDRARSIAAKMVGDCAKFGISPGRSNPRLSDKLELLAVVSIVTNSELDI